MRAKMEPAELEHDNEEQSRKCTFLGFRILGIQLIDPKIGKPLICEILKSYHIRRPRSCVY